MFYEILPDPRAFAAAKEKGVVQVLNIHRPIPERVPVGHFDESSTEIVDEVVSRTVYLDRIQQACVKLKDKFEVRFYNHFEDVFDAAVLDHLPEIRCLAIDSLPRVRNPEAIGRLPKLTSLRFGPREVDDPKILGALGLHRLEYFTLAGTPSPAVDLAPFAEARSLRSLRLLGHGKNTEAIGHATSLSELAIQPSSKFSLEFINRLTSLEALKFVLGSATSIRAIEALPALRDLSFREVRSLEDLGDLQRFQRLRRLQVSDQPKVAELHVGHRNAALEHLYLYSLPRLHRLDGFSALPAVKSLFAYNSLLDLPWSGLPSTLTHFQLMSKTVKGRDAHDAQVRAKGLIPAVHPGAVFFYK
jgi:hypothetical protein